MPQSCGARARRLPESSLRQGDESPGAKNKKWPCRRDSPTEQRRTKCTVLAPFHPAETMLERVLRSAVCVDDQGRGLQRAWAGLWREGGLRCRLRRRGGARRRTRSSSTCPLVIAPPQRKRAQHPTSSADRVQQAHACRGCAHMELPLLRMKHPPRRVLRAQEPRS
jgi:hypothetical protein